MLAIARYNYWREVGKGEKPADISSLTGMQDVLRSRGAELYQKALSGGATPEDARLQAARMLSQEFGI